MENKAYEEILVKLQAQEVALKENTEIVQKLYRAHVRQRTWQTVKLMVVVLLMLGAYWFVKPLVQNLISSYQDILQNLQGIKAGFSAFPDITGVNTLLNL